ncbi:hypothetical protein E2C01_042559 [Portunus trituberculatus]|uniref:Uncharacterized protein n=1 Tax=Portunus trituberculatus TaxID=210409 RepID=A0A5B7FTD0_PORTR|nr:hypothetical protein [Portunus trituberculatus]
MKASVKVNTEHVIIILTRHSNSSRKHRSSLATPILLRLTNFRQAKKLPGPNISHKRAEIYDNGANNSCFYETAGYQSGPLSQRGTASPAQWRPPLTAGEGVQTAAYSTTYFTTSYHHHHHHHHNH